MNVFAKLGLERLDELRDDVQQVLCRGVFIQSSKLVDSLSHTTWRCQYQVVFAPKYRRMVIYGQIKKDIGQILRKLCEQKDIEIIEAEACPDHIHTVSYTHLDVYKRQTPRSTGSRATA